jgi:FkbM family methyltransferase
MDWIARIIARSGAAPRGVIHVGANDGGEFPLYVRHGIFDQIWIEPQPEPFGHLLDRLWRSPRIRAFNVACGSIEGKARMTVLAGNGGHSSSLLKPRKHLEYYPHLPVAGAIEVSLVRLDPFLASQRIDPERFDLLVLDVQGYELECLKGAEGLVRTAIRYVVAEVNREELYEGCALVGEMDEWLGGRGFSRVETDWCGPQESFGDALYVRGG